MPEILNLPTYDRLMNPLLKAIVAIGGSASIDEMYEEVIEQEGFSDELISVLQNPEKSSQTKIAYRLAWARTYLKKAGYLENSRRGVWALTEKGRENPEVDPAEIVRHVREIDGYGSRRDNRDSLSDDVDSTGADAPEEAQAWREQLHRILIDEMSPDAFERLTQRILRESGFIHVEVTGRTGDGGIDGPVSYTHLTLPTKRIV